jgi:molecular chaperone DnaJ
MAPQREWFEKDYYKALGVSDTATDKEIKAAYRRLSKQHHPDSGGDEEKFKDVSAAWDVLGDAAKRKEYDEVRRLGPMGGPFAGSGAGPGGFGGFGGGGPRGGNFTFNVGDAGDLGDLFGGLFGRGRGRGGRTQSGPRRGDDLEAELHLSFLDAINGVTTVVHVTSETTCSTCHGTGAAPGTSPVVCNLCSGRGVLDDDQGPFSISQPCPQCGGRGMVVERPCPTCRGTGNELRQREVKVRVPPGVDAGQRIRLKGRGGAGRNGGPPGDLYVVVRVGSHPIFGRAGDNLTAAVPVTFSEAALGAQITVPTLDGNVTVKIPPGTRSGRTFRVKGRGVPKARGVGDLLVTVEVAVPAKLSEEEREAIEALAAVSTDSPRKHLGV